MNYNVIESISESLPCDLSPLESDVMARLAEICMNRVCETSEPFSSPEPFDGGTAFGSITLFNNAIEHSKSFDNATTELGEESTPSDWSEDYGFESDPMPLYNLAMSAPTLRGESLAKFTHEEIEEFLCDYYYYCQDNFDSEEEFNDFIAEISDEAYEIKDYLANRNFKDSSYFEALLDDFSLNFFNGALSVDEVANCLDELIDFCFFSEGAGRTLNCIYSSDWAKYLNIRDKLPDSKQKEEIDNLLSLLENDLIHPKYKGLSCYHTVKGDNTVCVLFEEIQNADLYEGNMEELSQAINPFAWYAIKRLDELFPCVLKSKCA